MTEVYIISIVLKSPLLCDINFSHLTVKYLPLRGTVAPPWSYMSSLSFPNQILLLKPLNFESSAYYFFVKPTPSLSFVILCIPPTLHEIPCIHLMWSLSLVLLLWLCVCVCVSWCVIFLFGHKLLKLRVFYKVLSVVIT